MIKLKVIARCDNCRITMKVRTLQLNNSSHLAYFTDKIDSDIPTCNYCLDCCRNDGIRLKSYSWELQNEYVKRLRRALK